jgi:hypothetical protein
MAGSWNYIRQILSLFEPNVKSYENLTKASGNAGFRHPKDVIP